MCLIFDLAWTCYVFPIAKAINSCAGDCLKSDGVDGGGGPGGRVAIALWGGDEPGMMLVQRPRETRDIWRQVYELMPELPREDQYVSRETGGGG